MVHAGSWLPRIFALLSLLHNASVERLKRPDIVRIKLGEGMISSDKDLIYAPRAPALCRWHAGKCLIGSRISEWELFPLAVRLGTKKSVVLETEGLGPQPFHGHIVILVNEHTTGAAEMVTLFAKENSLATIVGTETPGRLISRTGTKVGDGYQLVFPVAAYQSWNGTRIEGSGIEPDIRVAWSFEDAQRGEDSQLDRALEVLRDK